MGKITVISRESDTVRNLNDHDTRSQIRKAADQSARAELQRRIVRATVTRTKRSA